MIAVSNNIAEMHAKNSGRNARDYELCARYAKISQLITIGVPIMYAVIIIGFQSPAFLAILTEGKISPSMHIYLPGFNQVDRLQMSILLLINFTFSAYCLVAIISVDVFTGIHFATIPMFSTIIQRQINDYKTELEEMKKSKNLTLMKRKLVEIMEMQLKYNE